MDNIVYLQNLREEKENQFVSFVSKHRSSIHTYVDRQVNIREKVKAKHIFTDLVNCEKGAVFSPLEERLFLDWFTYDYLTIRGMTIYQSFIEYSNRQSHPLDSVVHALFMASVLEPFKVIKYSGKHIYAEKILTGEECVIKTNINKPDLNETDTLFLRTIPVLDAQLCVSELFFQPDHFMVESLLTHYKKSTDSWRTFLKKYSIKYSWTCQSSK